MAIRNVMFLVCAWLMPHPPETTPALRRLLPAAAWAHKPAAIRAFDLQALHVLSADMLLAKGYLRTPSAHVVTLRAVRAS